MPSWDEMLCLHGFRIAARPAHGEPVWEKDGTRYPEAAAKAAVIEDVPAFDAKKTPKPAPQR